MKKLSFVFLFVLLFSCNQQENTSIYERYNIDTTAFKADNKKIESTPPKKSLTVIMKDEPKVVEWVYTDANVLYISVYDDGTRRDGLAEYFCFYLKDEGYVDLQKVKIIKAFSTKDPDRDNAYGVLIGESWCR